MEIEQQLQDKIDAFLAGNLDEPSRIEFEREIANNASLAAKIKATELEQAILEVVSEQDLRQQLKTWDGEVAKTRARFRFIKKWLLGSAVMVIITSILIFYFRRPSPIHPFPEKEERLSKPEQEQEDQSSNKDELITPPAKPSAPPIAWLEPDPALKKQSLERSQEGRGYLSKMQVDTLKENIPFSGEPKPTYLN